MEYNPEEKEEFKSNLKGQIAGIGTEVTGVYATDLLTANLLNPATIASTGGWSILGYGVVNFASGAGTNIAAQKLRGEEEIGWGEVISSGLIDIIPFFGQKVKGVKGVTNVALQSGARTVAQRQGEVALDDQRWLTPRETLEAAALGGAFGAGFKGTGEGINLLKGKYRKYKLSEAQKKFPPEVVNILQDQNRISDATVDMMRQQAGLKMLLRKSIDPEDTSLSQRNTKNYGKKQRRLTEPVNIEIVKELQSKYGGSDNQVKAFVQANKAAEKDVRDVIDLLNSLSLKDIEAGKVLLDSGVKLTRKQEQGLIKQLTEQGDLYSLGHIRAVKNLWLAGDKGANRITNMEPELWHNLERIIYNEFGEAVGTEIVQLGNAARKANYDKDDLINLVQGVSRTLDEEYLKFIDPEITDFFDFLPREYHGHFEESIEASMRMKRRFFGKQDVIPRQQRDLYQKWLREAIDEYLAGMDNQGLGTLMNAMFKEGNRIPPWMRKVNEKLDPPKKLPKKKYPKKKP